MNNQSSVEFNQQSVAYTEEGHLDEYQFSSSWPIYDDYRTFGLYLKLFSWPKKNEKPNSSCFAWFDTVCSSAVCYALFTHLNVQKRCDAIACCSGKMTDT